jgi:hypothetical protein
MVVVAHLSTIEPCRSGKRRPDIARDKSYGSWLHVGATQCVLHNHRYPSVKNYIHKNEALESCKRCSVPLCTSLPLIT